MRKTAFRIVQTKFAANAFDGEGARLYGGRWNSPGTSMVYTSSSLSLATLEMLVHIEDISIIYGRYTVIPIEFDDALVHVLEVATLPARWNSPEPLPGTQVLGDGWVQNMVSAVLEVPSAVTEHEANFLLNPLHPDFPKITIGKAFVLKPDSRLVRAAR